MKAETLALAGLLDTRRRRVVTALVIGLITAAICLSGPRLTVANVVVFAVVVFAAVWGVATYLCATARRTLADR
jgi:hypothetical protein